MVDLYFDGGSRGNPGKAGAGAHLIFEDHEVYVSEYLGEGKTNNEAEYHALAMGLKEVGDNFVNIYGDSKLVIMQLKGSWGVKAKNLIPYYEECKRLLEGVKSYTLNHVPRARNGVADGLANEAMDRN